MDNMRKIDDKSQTPWKQSSLYQWSQFSMEKLCEFCVVLH